MSGRLLRVHCELGPVLCNRTAVYKICKLTPAALTQRGFHVRCSALLARIAPETLEPLTPRQRHLFQQSQQWLTQAICRPSRFLSSRWLTGFSTAWRHGLGLRLFLDPLYVLFYGLVQDAVVLVYDITPASDPAWHHPHVGRLYEAAFAHLARSRCHLVASCQNTYDQLRVNYGIAPSRLTHLPLGLFGFPETAPRQPDAEEAPFLLFVGATEELRKNVVGLIQAYGAAGLYQSRGIRLRILGSHAGEDHPVVVAARATPGVDLMGFVSDAVVAASYERCLGLVFPSFHEGFGLPLLEAMARGCVCVASILGASPEVGGDAVLYVNPYSQSEIIRALWRVVELPAAERQRLARLGRQRARQFTWDRFYDGLAALLRRRLRAA